MKRTIFCLSPSLFLRLQIYKAIASIFCQSATFNVITLPRLMQIENSSNSFVGFLKPGDTPVQNLQKFSFRSFIFPT